ncbi:MAG: toxin-antitoxin (TA) system antitoxin [Candidatus Sumerlaeota bacterium]|nr:toxin-antitoxin (TA) system antitoxin [Candidatus Sumerlaeota bacterium]
MIKTVDITEAQAHLSELLRMLEPGAEIIIEDRHTPMARVLPIPAHPGKRIAGLGKGEGWISDDFDEPLPDEFWLGNDK